MSHEATTPTVEIPLAALVSLAVECWRLKTSLTSASAAKDGLQMVPQGAPPQGAPPQVPTQTPPQIHGSNAAGFPGVSASPASAGVTSPALRHALRRIDDFLALCELEIRTFDGQAFDPGLALQVIDFIDDSALASTASRVEETLSPMVIWRGCVVKPAEVVVRRGAGQSVTRSSPSQGTSSI